MSDTTTIDTVDSHLTDTHIPNTSHSWEAKVMELSDDSHSPVGDTSAEVADAVADTIDNAKKTSPNVLKKTKKIKAPSKAMVAMKKWVDDMKASVTRPVKNVVNKIRTRAMDIVNKMRSWEKLSIKQASLIFLAPGWLAILATHYANMFSKRAQTAIEAGKVKWEAFLHSLWLSHDATSADIAHAEAAHGDHGVTTPVWEVATIGHQDSVAANDGTEAVHAHGNTEHPGQERHAA